MPNLFGYMSSPSTTPSVETRPVSVRVLKYDGTEYRRWNAWLARLEGSLIVLDAAFETDVEHSLLETIPRGTRTIEYYWLDRWYNVFRFLHSDGNTRLWYCNISTPAKLEGAVVSYVDLDIDVLVQPDLSYEVLDQEDFDINAQRLGYPEQTQRRAREAVDELILMIERRQFPFVEDRL